MRHMLWCIVLSLPLFPVASFTLPQSASSTATAACNFDKTKQVAIEYQRFAINVKKMILGDEIPYGKVWAPGGKPMTMFTNTPLTIGGKEIPVAAYTMFVIPEEKSWTLLISKSTDTSGKYDEHDDLARIPMEVGKLPNPESQFSVYLAHIAATQCNMRLDLDKTRAWVTIEEKK